MQASGPKPVGPPTGPGDIYPPRGLSNTSPGQGGRGRRTINFAPKTGPRGASDSLSENVNGEAIVGKQARRGSPDGAFVVYAQVYLPEIDDTLMRVDEQGVGEMERFPPKRISPDAPHWGSTAAHGDSDRGSNAIVVPGDFSKKDLKMKGPHLWPEWYIPKTNARTYIFGTLAWKGGREDLSLGLLGRDIDNGQDS